MGFKNILVAAAMPVLKLLIVTSAGSFLATNRVGILCEDALKHLNNVVFYLFDPAFVYINLAKTITLKSMVSLKNLIYKILRIHLMSIMSISSFFIVTPASGLVFFHQWFMPLNILLTFIIGTILGWVVIQITKPPSHLRGLILGCCAGGNLGNMLIIIVPAICKEKGGPFGAEDVCNRYGLAYASLSMAVASIFLWSYVYNIIRISSSKIKKSIVIDAPTSTSLPEETSKTLPGEQISMQDSAVHEDVEDRHEPSSTKTEELKGKPEVQTPSKLKQALKTISGKVDVKKLLAPSTIAVIIGFAVGIIAPFRKALVGESAPLRAIQSSIALLGDGDIPTTTLIMGGNLTKGIHRSEIRVSILVAIIVVRYIALPFLGVLVVKGAIHFGLVHKDPLYQFILLLQFTLPPAVTIGIMTQLFGAGESECAVIFLVTYALAIVSLTLWSAFFIWLVT